MVSINVPNILIYIHFDGCHVRETLERSLEATLRNQRALSTIELSNERARYLFILPTTIYLTGDCFILNDGMVYLARPNFIKFNRLAINLSFDFFPNARSTARAIPNAH